MRKLILIAAFALASASAQAGDGRSLTLAANDAPAAAATAQPAAPATAQPEAATADVKADTAQPAAANKQASRSKKTHARRYEGDEAKARRIAARYGVYW